MFRKTLLVAVLIAANLVATSTMTSASAQTLQELAQNDGPTQQAIIESAIREVFPENVAARIIAIAQCESARTHVQDNGEIFRSSSGAFVGVLQVSIRVHRTEIDRLLREEGRDVLGNVREYLLFTRYLYDYAHRHNRNGFAPWPSCGRSARPTATHTTGRYQQTVQVAQAH